MQTENPYASPVAFNPEPLVAELGPVVPASQGKRFLNWLIDQVFTTVVSYAAGMVLGVVYITARTNPTAPIRPDEVTQLNLIGYALGIVIVLTYFILTEIVWQRSLGKLLTGTRVVSADGGRPTVGQIVGRTFARFIPFDAFSYLATDPVGWHDSLSKTRVVNVR